MRPIVCRPIVCSNPGDGDKLRGVDRPRCAVEIQSGLAEGGAGVPSEKLEYRVGIHVGDVVEESDADLMGDGVNIAARLEGICDLSCPRTPTGKSSRASSFGSPISAHGTSRTSPIRRPEFRGFPEVIGLSRHP